jgi:hypothetical protein
LLAGCGGGESGPVEMDALDRHGVTAHVELIPVDAEHTRVVIELRRSAEAAPAHIHEGSCDRIDPTPANLLAPVVGRRSETVVAVSLDHLRSSPHAIDVHRRTGVRCLTVGG